MKLSEGITLYVDHERANGIDFSKGHSNFLSLRRSLGDIQLSDVRSQDVLRFLNGPKTSTVTFRGKHSQIRYFFEFMASRELMAEIPSSLAIPVPEAGLSTIGPGFTRRESNPAVNRDCPKSAGIRPCEGVLPDLSFIYQPRIIPPAQQLRAAYRNR
jgi:hypothetical protein